MVNRLIIVNVQSISFFKVGDKVLCMKVTLGLLMEETRLVVYSSLFRSWRSYSGAGGYMFNHTKLLTIQYKIMGNIITIRDKEVNKCLSSIVSTYTKLSGINS